VTLITIVPFYFLVRDLGRVCPPLVPSSWFLLVFLSCDFDCVRPPLVFSSWFLLVHDVDNVHLHGFWLFSSS
jgi:hypothetical protein